MKVLKPMVALDRAAKKALFAQLKGNVGKYPVAQVWLNPVPLSYEEWEETLEWDFFDMKNPLVNKCSHKDLLQFFEAEVREVYDRKLKKIKG